MARIKGATMTHKRRAKTLKLAKGYYGAKSKHFRMAKQAVMKSGNYAFVGRKQKKRQFRNLWPSTIPPASTLWSRPPRRLCNSLHKRLAHTRESFCV